MQVDKLFHQIFHLFDTEWYETQDQYRPSDELLLIVREVVPATWQISRGNKWYYAKQPGLQLPDQGWKIHVSASLATCEDILRATARVCYESNASFKFTLDRRSVALTTSKIWPREASGKFITIYPLDDEHFHQIIEALYQALQGFTGPYILSDRRYKDSQVVYYRYGGISGFNVLTYVGDRAYMLKAPDGENVPDMRNPYWNPPAWVEDPFGQEDDEEDEDDDGETTLKNGRYRVEDVLGTSVTGGVYLATDLQNDVQVIIKEARPATAVDEYGIDAIERLHKEYRLLQKLSGSKVVPEPVELFQDWEHWFLVEEYIDGVDLGRLTTSSSPFIRIFPDQEMKKAHVALLRKIWANLAKGVLLMHSQGIVYGDFSIKNVIVSDKETGELRFIDLEGAWEKGVDLPARITTPGFTRQTQGDAYGPQDDIYGLGAVMLGSLFPITNLLAVEPGARVRFNQELSSELGVPADIEHVIEQCMNDDPLERPTPQQVLDVVNTAQPGLTAPPATTDQPLQETIKGIMEYIHACTDVNRKDRLFPADPMVFLTKPLNLAYGASGVAYAMARLEGEVPRQVRTWMLERAVTPEMYPPGLYTGAAGIAWAFWESGLQEVALQTLRAADNHPLLWKSLDLFYGAAGYGLSCLHFARATGEQGWLDRAITVGEELLRRKNEDENGDSFWVDDQGETWMGYAHGASGIALYLLYLSIATGEQKFLEAGKRALSFDLAHLETTEEGFLIFPRGPRGSLKKVLTHYWLDGSAGVLTTLVRFWAYTRDEEYRSILDILAPDVMRKYTAFPGLFLGLSGLGNALLDLADFTGEEQFLQAAHRTASGTLLYRLQRPTGIAFPGEQLLRISTDFATGSAGIALFLDRLARQEKHPGNFNFTLDALIPAHRPEGREATFEGELIIAGREQ